MPISRKTSVLLADQYGVLKPMIFMKSSATRLDCATETAMLTSLLGISERQVRFNYVDDGTVSLIGHQACVLRLEFFRISVT